MPKVKRGAPATGSMPTMEISRPRAPEMRALTMDLPARATSREMPTTIRAKNSGGPTSRPSSPRGLAAATRPMVAMVPPTKDPTAAMVSAAPALPSLVIA